MFKAIVLISVIVSLAYSAPYGGYGGSSSGSNFDGGLGKVRDIGISFDSGKGLGASLEGKGMEMSFGTKDIGLGEVRHEFVAPVSTVGLGEVRHEFVAPVSTVGLGEVRHEFVAPVSTVGLGEVRREFVAPIASASIGLGEVRHEIAAPLSSSNFIGSSSSVVGVGAPIVQRLEAEPVVLAETRPVEVITHAPFIAHEAPQALSIPRVELPVLKSSGGY